MKPHRSNLALQFDQPDLFRASTLISPKEVLENSQRTFGTTDGKNIYELCLDLATPAVVTAEKSNAPVIGLPTLDGFLSYVAFRAALAEALQTNSDPELSKLLLWQWNVALRDPNMWIDFQLPLREIPFPGKERLKPLFDCSIGLPIDANGEVLTPVGALFTSNGQNFKGYPEIVDSIPLRRRITEPFGRPIQLERELDASRGSTKALDNRLYFPLTKSYAFFFRGDKDGVKSLLDFAINERVGLGKKTTLGYGQIGSFEVIPRPDVKATWAKPISGSLYGNDKLALIKDLPYDRVFARREIQDADRRKEQYVRNQELFGCRRFSLVATIETYGTYRPPYWLREQRTQIVRHGSIIQERQN